MMDCPKPGRIGKERMIRRDDDDNPKGREDFWSVLKLGTPFR